MPKDEFDFEDPFELNGMAFLTHEDTTDNMAECFIEEFMRMGYGNRQILALFKDSHYLGPNMAFEKRGEPFIRELIAEVFARWGRVASWGVPPADASMHPARDVRAPESQKLTTEIEESAETDPMGEPVPKLNV